MDKKPLKNYSKFINMSVNKKIIFLLLFTGLSFQTRLTPQTNINSQNESEWEAFPIISYDSDAGLGYGVKGFFYNFLKLRESFDLILFNSTKGEHWYRFVFSDVDIQRRQGTKYPAAIDLIVDYDKWISYRYYYSNYDFTTGKITDEVYPL